MSSDAAVSRWSLKMSVLRFAPPEISRVLMVLGSLRVAVVSKWYVLRREIVLGMPETAQTRRSACQCHWHFKLPLPGTEIQVGCHWQ